MPKSKRSKLVHLSKTKPKGSKMKENLVEQLQSSCGLYEFIYVFQVENMRNTSLKDIRNKWSGSRFFFGKNKVMIHALGRTAEDEHKDNLSKLSRRIKGGCGLLFTNTPKADVLKFFSEFSEPNFARSKCKATGDFSLDKGPLTLPFSMETRLRALGLKTKLKDGIIDLLADTMVCKKGDVLSPEQCKILEIFEVQMAEMKIHVDCMWSDGVFESLRDETEGGEEEEDGEEDDEEMKA